MTNICPICHQEETDMRHVSIDCFYDVQEVVPEAKEEDIWKEVPFNDNTYLGYVRQYPAGEEETIFLSSKEERDGVMHHVYEKKMVSCDPIRLVSDAVYTLTCCKSCRADFLKVLKDWYDGKFFVPEAYDTEDRNIFVRVRGTNVGLTRAEYDLYQVGSLEL